MLQAVVRIPYDAFIRRSSARLKSDAINRRRLIDTDAAPFILKSARREIIGLTMSRTLHVAARRILRHATKAVEMCRTAGRRDDEEAASFMLMTLLLHHFAALLSRRRYS